MEQERGYKHKHYQPASSKKNTLLYISAEDTIHFVPSSVYSFW